MNMPETFKVTLKFLIVLFVLTVINAIIWQFVADGLYDCTDGGVPGYFTPGNWVHDTERHSVAIVPKVIHGRSMSEPDMIQANWSLTSLLYLWSGLFGSSLLVSYLLAQSNNNG